tara:strand:- start:2665 stop:4755 length:2091 start_codon:yes stop_codon:yes gene_type:complete
MPDLEISQLPALAGSGLQATDPIPVADISASETKKVTAKDLVQRGVALIDAASIPATALSYPLSANSIVTASVLDANITNAKLANSSISLGGLNLVLGSTDATPALDLTDATNYPTSSLSGTITNSQLAGSIEGSKLLDTTIAYVKLNLSNGDIPGAKITASSLTSTQLGTDSVTATQIAENAVGASEIGSAVITNSHIASNTIQAGNVAPNAIGSSELADASVDTLAVQDSAITTAKINNAAVTNDKLAGSIAGTKLLSSTITSTQLGTNSVTSTELADNSVDTAAIATSAVTDVKIASGIDGSKITDGTILPVKLNASNIDRSLNVSGDNLGINNAVSGGASARSGITYNNEGLITATTALVASDLPEATTSAIGAVSVPTAGGLSVTNLGALSISNSISAVTISGLTFNTFGQLTSSSALVGGDLPVATASIIGAIKVPTTSAPLAVDGNGVLSIADSGIASGTYEKVTVNAQGIVTAGTDLAAVDIPSLDASKITTGSLATARIADDAITMDKLGSGAISFIQEAQPAITNLPTGVYWLQESTGQLRIFNGNSWFSVGFGRLAEENLRFSGTFNASNGLIVTLTSFGTSAGFSAGNAIPAGTAATTGCYFVCVVAGNGTAVVPSTSFDAGDWALCMGLNDWDRVDTLSGPGSVSALDDLSDVSIDTPTAGQFFEYAADGQWKNVSEIAGGTY